MFQVLMFYHARKVENLSLLVDLVKQSVTINVEREPAAMLAAL